MRTAPFDLPKDPVDKYEIRWWTVETYDVPTVVAHRAVYHIDSTWKEVIGDDGGRPGVSFTDDWQIFRGDSFVGRQVGWGINGWRWDDRDHTTLADAKAEAIVRSRRLLDQAREKIAMLEEALRALGKP